MAVHLGYDACAWIHQSETDVPLDCKTWLGHVTVHGRERGRDDSRMIAVAGLVAETLWRNGHDEEYGEPYGWEDHLLDEDSMSPSDWRLADCEPGDPDDELFSVAAEVASLFMGKMWPVLTSMSRTLMRDASVVHEFSQRKDERYCPAAIPT